MNATTTEIRIYGTGHIELFRDGKYSGSSVYMGGNRTMAETMERAKRMAEEYTSPTTRETPPVRVMSDTDRWGLEGAA